MHIPVLAYTVKHTVKTRAAYTVHGMLVGAAGCDVRMGYSTVVGECVVFPAVAV